MMFAYNTSYHRSVKSTLFEITFGLEPRTAENSNPYVRRQYGEDLGTEMFQRLQTCQNLARKIASEYNDRSIEESTKYFNSKVIPVEFKEEDWVLMSEHNFLHKNLGETFKGPFKITKVHPNGTLLIRTKASKHEHLVNTKLLVKYIE
jgi:hypothetical protein